jgi:hypothetical protein
MTNFCIEFFKQRRMIGRMSKARPFKPTEKQKAEIQKWIDKWKPLLFLQEWKIILQFEPEANPASKHNSAKTSADCTYKRAWITFYPCFFDDDDETREHTVVHELVHCITMIMKDPAYIAIVEENTIPWHVYKEADERCTQQIANVVFELYRRGTAKC